MNESYEYLIEVQNLHREYVTTMASGEKIHHPVLKGITFSVHTGDFIGVMGTSGCGKTTLLKTLGMFNRPDEGRVLYKGMDTKHIYGEKLAGIRRREIAYIYQDYNLMDSLDVRDNIMLPLILNEDNIEESLEKAEHIAKQFGINALLDKRPGELSGGEKQRVAICRAMVADPELILADEPTGNLDSSSSKNVIRILQHVNKKYKKTILLVTHDPKMASYCDKVFLLKDGELLDILVKEETQKDFFKTVLRKMTQL